MRSHDIPVLNPTWRAKRILTSALTVLALSAVHFSAGFASVYLREFYNRGTLVEIVFNVLWFPFLYLALEYEKSNAGLFFLIVIANSLFWGVTAFAIWTGAVRAFGKRFSLSALLVAVTFIAVAMGLISAYASAVLNR